MDTMPLTLQFDIIMLDVAAADPAGDPGTLNSIPAQFLSAHFIQDGLCRRLRYASLPPRCLYICCNCNMHHALRYTAWFPVIDVSLAVSAVAELCACFSCIT